ncbi:MAG: hypothetical protein Q8S33_05180 [Myxococcales bacterium]|nr:hypothetical protein [Myxococcales bacterium]
MIMLPSEELLTIEDVAEDRRRRTALLAALTVGTVGPASVLWFGTGLCSMLLALMVGAGAFVVASRYEVEGRFRAVFRIRHLREAGLAAVTKLTAGDVAGARDGFVALLPQARSMQAIHATHVLMYGVTRFLEGDTTEGLRLAERALKSGWFDLPKMRDLERAAATWTTMMLVTAKRLGDARALLTQRPAYATASVVLEAAEGRFTEAVSTARAALGAADFPPAGRPTVAIVGLFAARQLNESHAITEFEAVLAATPPGPLALKNPALAPFLPAAFR